MPILASTYQPALFFKSAHIATIYPNLFRSVRNVKQIRERLELQDGDFLDLDWSFAKSKKSKHLTLILHGLEGNAQRPYMKGLTKQMTSNNIDAVAINLRNCSNQPNRLYASYHAGASDDLALVVQHITSNYNYEKVSICGFSLGGNIVLKYLGETEHIPSIVKSAVAISVPCDLHDSLQQIEKPFNFIYRNRFIRHLKTKLLQRAKDFPNSISHQQIRACKSLMDIDDLYTSRAHGFLNAEDYYLKCSSKNLLSQIALPTLILNAKNDSFLGTSCYPIDEAQANPKLYLEMPEFGGHVGFYDSDGSYYHELRAYQFISRF
ncbi:YheT family hydrolase [Aquimarina sp. W85]|uniref:YheT family hydrolase n=1 Tax=Aquimarina rhodophyticola TaxID=3342246 RepID=UPI00366C846F